MWELSTDQGGRYITEWSEVESVFDGLNNTTQAYLSLALEDGTLYMEIYGGNQNRVVASFTDETDDEDEVILYDESQTESIPIYSVTDSETWDNLPPEACVDKSLAKQALKHFFDTEERDESLDWRGWPETD